MFYRTYRVVRGFCLYVLVCLAACLFLMIEHTGLAHAIGAFRTCLLGAWPCLRLRYSDEECLFVLDLPMISQ